MISSPRLTHALNSCLAHDVEDTLSPSVLREDEIFQFKVNFMSLIETLIPRRPDWGAANE